MKNTAENQEVGLFAESYPSFICVHPVHLTKYWNQPVRPCPLRSHCGLIFRFFA